MIDTTSQHTNKVYDESKTDKKIGLWLLLLLGMIVGLGIGFLIGFMYNRTINNHMLARTGFSEYRIGVKGEPVFALKARLLKLEEMVGEEELIKQEKIEE